MSNKNISSNSNMSKRQFLELWKKDKSPNKPKKLYISNVPTQKAIAYNNKLVKQGKTEFLLDPKKIIRKVDNKIRIIKKPIDLRSGKIKKSFLKKNIVFGSVTTPKSETITKTLSSSKLGTTWNDDSNYLQNNNLIKLMTKNLNGNYRIIINKNGDNILDNVYDINKNFWKNNQSDFLSEGSPPVGIWVNSSDNGSTVTFIITKDKVLPFKYYKQTFREGLTNCLLTPINNYFLERLENSKTKNSISNMKVILKKIKKYIEKFKGGVPEKEISTICNDIRISIDVEQPFNNKKFIEVRPQKKSYKLFKFLNTKLNHVDYNENGFSNLYKSFDKEFKTQDELNIIYNDLKDKEFLVYSKGLNGINSLKTLNNFYQLNSDFYQSVEQFEKETGLFYCDIDALRYPDLQDFINSGTHFNGTVDFKDISHLEYLTKKHTPPKNLSHIDMKKAYSQFHQSKFYSGFMGQISDFRKVKKVEYNGLYYVTELDFSNIDKKFKFIIDKLQWFYPNNIYTKQELDAFEYYGGKYKVSHGAFGVNPLDFKFNDKMLNSVEEIKIGENVHKIKYYAKYTGVMASLKGHKNFYMKGNRDFLQTIEQDENLHIYFNEFDDENRIAFIKKYMYNKKHITAQITAYQRLNMVEQLLKMDLSKIYRICVDGIYYEKHEFEINDIFSFKDDMTFQNKPTETYLSSVISETQQFDLIKINSDNLGDYRKVVKNEFQAGAGGTGKTYFNLNDKGLINPVYVAPSWKLAADISNNYNNNKRYVPVCVHHYLLNEPYAIQEAYTKKYSNYIIDEASMLTEHQKKILFDCLPKTIFMGDLNFQLPPVIPYCKNQTFDMRIQMTLEDFDLVKEFTKNYRFQDKELLDLTQYVRDNIENKIDYKALPIQHITIDELKKQYKKEDIILRHYNELTNKRIDFKFTDIFKDIPKYKITQNFYSYKNGEIVFEKVKGVESELRHGYTIHSVQGSTFRNNIYIYLNGCEDNRMFFTAISRARFHNQIYLIYN